MSILLCVGYVSIKAVEKKKSSSSSDFNSRGCLFVTLHGPLHLPGLSFLLFNRDRTWLAFRLFMLGLNDLHLKNNVTY